MRRVAALLAALALAGSAGASEAGRVFRLHADGYGPVRVGMSVGEAERALGSQLAPAGYSSPADGCWHLKSARGHEGVQFMIQRGRFTRASLWDRSDRIRTLRGVTVGDTEHKVRRLYGSRLEVLPHAYGGPKSRYLTYWTQARTRGVRFETDDESRVESIHTGDSSIQLIEGCS
jgi:hypothetical protein